MKILIFLTLFLFVQSTQAETYTYPLTISITPLAWANAEWDRYNKIYYDIGKTVLLKETCNYNDGYVNFSRFRQFYVIENEKVTDFGCWLPHVDKKRIALFSIDRNFLAHLPLDLFIMIDDSKPLINYGPWCKW